MVKDKWRRNWTVDVTEEVEKSMKAMANDGRYIHVNSSLCAYASLKSSERGKIAS